MPEEKKKPVPPLKKDEPKKKKEGDKEEEDEDPELNELNERLGRDLENDPDIGDALDDYKSKLPVTSPLEIPEKGGQ